jgi:hypothetical protein
MAQSSWITEHKSFCWLPARSKRNNMPAIFCKRPSYWPLAFFLVLSLLLRPQIFPGPKFRIAGQLATSGKSIPSALFVGLHLWLVHNSCVKSDGRQMPSPSRGAE